MPLEAADVKDKEGAMRFLLAILLPFSVFFTIGRPISGLICLILQITLIGWIPAAIWAVYALNNYHTEKRVEKMRDEIISEVQKK